MLPADRCFPNSEDMNDTAINQIIRYSLQNAFGIARSTQASNPKISNTNGRLKHILRTPQSLILCPVWWGKQRPNAALIPAKCLERQVIKHVKCHTSHTWSVPVCRSTEGCYCALYLATPKAQEHLCKVVF